MPFASITGATLTSAPVNGRLEDAIVYALEES